MDKLTTVWGEQIDPQAVLTEYPRPQMARASYVNLNGYWDCAFARVGEAPTAWQRILVPFSPEAPLSGVGRALARDEMLWYRRALPDVPGSGGRVLLHFGAVDQQAEVYVSGVPVARHAGGYTPFSADITDAMTDGERELTVCVRDETDAAWHSRGKQRTKRGGIWYTPQSGIWQTVWMERVPDVYITSLEITPCLEEKACRIVVKTNVSAPVCVTFEGRTHEARSGEAVTLVPEAFLPWSPESPHLYAFTAACGEDCVESYFALRSVAVRADAQGVARLFLNGRPYFQTGLLDQGYWPDGLYTAPSDAAMIHDIRTARDMGFNMLRKHIKVEPLRWYYHCDRLGMLVWQDMVNGGRRENPLIITAPLVTGVHLRDHHYAWFGRQDAQGRAAYYAELEETVRHLYNSPCVVLWVPFNEGWGQFDAAEAVRRIRALDATRVIDHASGWHDQGIGTLKSEHVYFRRYRFRPDRRGRCVVLSEFGGYTCALAGHVWGGKTFGYKKNASRQELFAQLRRLYEEEIIPARTQGLAAAVYTQVSDVEDEVNGMMTYDRRVTKVACAEMAAINARLRD